LDALALIAPPDFFPDCSWYRFSPPSRWLSHYSLFKVNLPAKVAFPLRRFLVLGKVDEGPVLILALWAVFRTQAEIDCGYPVSSHLQFEAAIEAL
jgi:hypothetical protein